jgi:hypothetical protein
MTKGLADFAFVNTNLAVTEYASVFCFRHSLAYNRNAGAVAENRPVEKIGISSAKVVIATSSRTRFRSVEVGSVRVYT